jgi:hypothetical protein
MAPIQQIRILGRRVRLVWRVGWSIRLGHRDQVSKNVYGLRMTLSTSNDSENRQFSKKAFATVISCVFGLTCGWCAGKSFQLPADERDISRP